MTIQKEAIDLEDWELLQKGLPPRPEVKVVRPEPEPPVVENQVHFSDLPADFVVEDIEARYSSRKNCEGSHFTGFNLFLKLADGRVFSGWMQEGDLYLLRKKIPVERTDLLQKTGW